MINFWEKIQKKKKGKPILALAPLAGYTDSAFRSICKKFGADIVYSEMASVSALHYKSEKTLELLKFSQKERPYIVQLFGSDKKHFVEAVKIIEKEIKPDGFDINFGCPVKKVLKQEAGAKLMSNLKLSREIIKAVLSVSSKPLSIKVRTQSFSVGLIDFLKNIEDLPVSALMIHGRTLKQLFSGPIDLEIIKESKKYFKGVILANGGVNNYSDIEKIVKKTGIEGVGVGRGALGSPWIFSDKFKNISKNNRRELAQKTALEHLKLHFKNKGDLGLGEFKGHLAWYFKDFAGASKLRTEMMSAKNFSEIKKILIFDKKYKI
ncbi:MAG: tRNA-dihydrouridine synthase family protein [Patescibacteria group bacterium]|nr:tRNA-dihydrouridine synthase family protein [Patescibacteria group bacterium]